MEYDLLKTYELASAKQTQDTLYISYFDMGPQITGYELQMGKNKPMIFSFCEKQDFKKLFCFCIQSPGQFVTVNKFYLSTSFASEIFSISCFSLNLYPKRITEESDPKSFPQMARDSFHPCFQVSLYFVPSGFLTFLWAQL